MDVDGRTYISFRNFESKNHGNTVFGSLKLQLSKRDSNRRKQNRLKGNYKAGTAWRKNRTDRLRESFLCDTEKKYAIIKLELLAVV